MKFPVSRQLDAGQLVSTCCGCSERWGRQEMEQTKPIYVDGQVSASFVYGQRRRWKMIVVVLMA